jgi:hypothetical protein
VLGWCVTEQMPNGFFIHLIQHGLAQLAIVQVGTGNFDFCLAQREGGRSAQIRPRVLALGKP